MAEGARSTRFEITRRLGAGGIDVVYSAFDRERRMSVALKTLRETDPAAVQRFKREFRLLADVRHPNLVSLYELLSVNDELFISMELIDGPDIVTYLRGTTVELVEPVESDAKVTARGAFVRVRRSMPPGARSVDYVRTRDVFLQLARGVSALHRAGRLHRDIKPSNVLVDQSGRVVLCDFGLAHELRPVTGSGQRSTNTQISGTPGFMSPEQSNGEEQTEASDWYAVGCLLYRVLMGHVAPGPAEPTVTEHSVAEAPDALRALTHALRQRRPEHRPSADEVIRALGGNESPQRVSAAPPFVGRDKETTALESALRASREKPVVAIVVGESGIGKSTLLRTFLQSSVKTTEATVLTSRCLSRETIPYKAIDPWMDALTTTLSAWPRAVVDEWVTEEIVSLSKLFPVLRQVESIEDPPIRGFDAPEPRESRRRATRALGRLLGGLAANRPLILMCDDIQWADADSTSLISQLLATAPPHALFLFACRADETADMVTTTLRSDAATESIDVRRISLGPLSDDAVRSLVSTLSRTTDAKALDAAVRESQGRPFLAEQFAAVDGEVHAGAALIDAMRARLEALGKECVVMFDTLAAAGHPLPASVIGQVAMIPTHRAFAAYLSLDAARFIRQLVRIDGVALLELYHDRLRDIARPPTDEDGRQLHRRLAEALTLDPSTPNEMLADHWMRAGEKRRARTHALDAAASAKTLHAFDQAARLYALAIDLDPSDLAPHVFVDLADALSNAGQRTAGADAYLAAAKHFEGGEALALERRAGEELIRNGHLDQGMAVLTKVLNAYDVPVPKTPNGVLATIAWQRILLAARGLKFTPREEAAIPKEDLARVDVCWAVGSAVGFIDTILGTAFHTRGVRLALNAGESQRIVRGLATEATAHAVTGPNKGGKRALEVLDVAQEILSRESTPYALASHRAGAGLTHLLLGDFKTSVAVLDEALWIFRAECVNAGSEIQSAEYIRLLTLSYLGRYDEVRRVALPALEDAIRNGDLFMETNLRTRVMCDLLLAQDRASDARAQTAAAVWRWSLHGKHVQHYYHFVADMCADLYEGKFEQALERALAAETAFRGGAAFRLQLVRGRMHLLVAAAAGSIGAAGAAEVKRRAKALRAENTPYLHALAEIVDAHGHVLRDERDEAVRALDRAATALEAHGAVGQAWAARLRIAQIRGDQPPAVFAGGGEIAAPHKFARLFVGELASA